MRRSPVAVLLDPARDDEVVHQAASGLLSGLGAAPELDVTCWRFERGGSWRRPVIRTDDAPGPGLQGLAGVRSVRWAGPSTHPRVLAATVGARLIAGPTAARPRALVAVGADGAAYVSAALGRMLDVPVVVAVLPGDLAQGWTSRALQAARRADRLMAADVNAADQLARRGFVPWRPESGVDAVPTADAWLDLGRQLARGLVQGAEMSTSSS